MEYLEGESLADRISKGALPLEHVLSYGIEIASALDKAHHARIVHRDLKPGNIMLTKAGSKLLDFGLAKYTQQQAPIESLTTSLPTERKPLTQEGTILGTLQYMAPEQLAGEEADARTDIFAFGAVLYEMLTGVRAFQGKNKTSLIGAIVSGEPRSITALRPLTPLALEHVIEKCLAKDPDDRWQSAHDIAEELKWISEAGSRAGSAPPLTLQPHARERFAWGVAPLSVLAAAVLGIAQSRRPVPRSEPIRFTIELRDLQLGRPIVSQLAISGDGRRIAFATTKYAGVVDAGVSDGLHVRELNDDRRTVARDGRAPSVDQRRHVRAVHSDRPSALRASELSVRSRV